MTYRPLTYAEMAEFAGENLAAARWQTMRQFAVEIFGDAVRAVDVEFFEQGSGNLAMIVGVDANGDRLDPDFSTPFWQNTLPKYPAYVQPGSAPYQGPSDPRDVADLVCEVCQALGSRRRFLLQDVGERFNLAGPQLHYDFTNPPPLTIAAPFVQAS